jgi:subtilisin family serine protease
MGFAESSREVVIKLKTTQRVRRSLRVLAGIEATSRGTARSAAPGPLASIIEAGRVASIEPLFPTPRLRSASTVERMVMSVDEDVQQDQELAGLNMMRFESEKEAEDACGKLSRDASVEYAHHPQERFKALPRAKRARRRRRSSPPIDPLRSRQWALGAVELARAQEASGFQEAFDIVIGVIDSGVDSSHPDLEGIFQDEQSFTSGPLADTSGHGTHVCGIIAAVTNNGVGVSGTCQSRKLVSLKALDPYNAAGYYRAIRHATDHGVQVLNLSLGGGHDPTEELLIRRAIEQGMIVVAAMGNEGSSVASYPAAIDDVIAVGASTEVDGLATFSNTGYHINLVAPGVNILSTVPTYPSELAETTHYDSWPGTSMATPFVVATVALILARNPMAKLKEAEQALEKGADKVSELRGFSPRFGHGRLNVAGALAQIQTAEELLR